MKIHNARVIAGLCGVAGIVRAHEYGHHQHADGETPLHKQEFVQDSAEELARKWSFEVRSTSFTPPPKKDDLRNTNYFESGRSLELTPLRILSMSNAL
jgi:hypothetical protein